MANDLNIISEFGNKKVYTVFSKMTASDIKEINENKQSVKNADNEGCVYLIVNDETNENSLNTVLRLYLANENFNRVFPVMSEQEANFSEINSYIATLNKQIENLTLAYSYMTKSYNELFEMHQSLEHQLRMAEADVEARYQILRQMIKDLSNSSEEDDFGEWDYDYSYSYYGE